MDARSKFACLHIDDDSDGENFSPASNRKGSQNRRNLPNKGNNGRPNQSQAKGGAKLIVHAVEKRSRNKKSSKPKVVDPTTGLVVQDADDNYKEEQKFKEDLRLAMKESQVEVIPATVEDPGVKSLVDETMQKIDNEASSRKADLSESAAILLTLYKSKLSEQVQNLFEVKQELADSQDATERYKMKYKKLVELFKDAELTEKAKLVLDLDRARTAETELATQLAIAQSTLEQARSRIRQLENKK